MGDPWWTYLTNKNSLTDWLCRSRKWRNLIRRRSSLILTPVSVRLSVWFLRKCKKIKIFFWIFTSLPLSCSCCCLIYIYISKVIWWMSYIVDDAMAIFLALRSPEVEVIGLTSIYGNVYTTLATRNALHLVILLSCCSFDCSIVVLCKWHLSYFNSLRLVFF